MGVVKLKQGLGWHAIKRAPGRQGFAHGTFGGAFFGTRFFNGPNGGGLQFLDQLGENGFGFPDPDDEFAAKTSQFCSQVGDGLQKESQTVDATPGKARRICGKQVSRIEDPDPYGRFIHSKQGLVVDSKISPEPE